MNYNDENEIEREVFVKHLGLHLATLRGDSRISRTILAQNSRMHHQLTYDIEAGRKNVSVYMIARLARGLNLTLSEFFQGFDLEPID